MYFIGSQLLLSFSFTFIHLKSLKAVPLILSFCIPIEDVLRSYHWNRNSCKTSVNSVQDQLTQLALKLSVGRFISSRLDVIWRPNWNVVFYNVIKCRIALTQFVDRETENHNFSVKIWPYIRVKSKEKINQWPLFMSLHFFLESEALGYNGGILITYL